MKKYIIITLMIAMTLSLTAFSKKVNYIPLIQYEQHNYGSQKIFSPSFGILAVARDFQVIGIYSTPFFKDVLSNNYPDQYHTIDFLAELWKGKHKFINLLKSESDQPITGGLHTFQFASVWGYEIISKESFKFVLGTGLGISDFGIEMSNGKPLPIIPLPLIRMKTQSPWLVSKFDFITGPNLEFLLAPKEKVRLKGDLRIDKFRDNRDLIFDLSLHYRFFSEKDAMGDFAGLALGLSNNNLAFDLADKDKVFDYHYNSLYTELDLSLLKISSGYTFKNREMYGEDDKINFAYGFTFSIQALYQF